MRREMAWRKTAGALANRLLEFGQARATAAGCSWLGERAAAGCPQENARTSWRIIQRLDLERGHERQGRRAIVAIDSVFRTLTWRSSFFEYGVALIIPSLCRCNGFT